MRWYIIFIGISILFAQWFGWKDFIMYQYIAVVDGVFFTIGRNYSTNIANSATIREISIIYNDAGYVIGCSDHCRT